MCDDAKKIGNFAAYKAYTKKYMDFFGGVFKYLYMTTIDNLQPMIDQLNFDVLFATAQKNLNSSFEGIIKNNVKKTVDALKFDGDFDLYIGVDLGNIGGAAFLGDSGRPFVYIGIDRYISEEDAKILIAHEVNHMVRCAALGEINMFDFSERVVAEGLGTYCPIDMFYEDKTLTADLIEAVMMALPHEKIKDLMRNKDELEKNVVKEFGTQLTEEKMKKFFTWTGDDEEQPLSGYFVGLFIIDSLIRHGFTLAQLTAMPAHAILEKY